MITKLVFFALAVLFGFLTCWMYKKSDKERDNFGVGLVCLLCLILAVIFTLCAVIAH